MNTKNHRQVLLDTETTGLEVAKGHRIIEIGCVEMINRQLTGNTYHVYLNPERVIDEEAIRVHGISNQFLRDKPKFAQIADKYLAFTQDAELIIHNAPFDVGFLNHELSLLKDQKTTVEAHSNIFDTLTFARKKHPGARATLDALCKYYGIDNTQRTLHGALLDAEILADVYLAMTSSQFSLLDFSDNDNAQKQGISRLSATRPKLKVMTCTPTELIAHKNHLQQIKAISGKCLWHTLE